jgi:hypothetical protein
MEQILNIAINSLGMERVEEILAELKHNELVKKPAPEAEKPKKEKKAKKEEIEEEKPKKAKKEVEEEKTTKRISRMSPNLSKQLQSHLEKVGLKYDEDNKKDYDKVKKEFVSYVDSLTEDDFTAKSLTDHMKDFADTKAPKAGGKPAEKKVPTGPPKDADIKELTLEELQKIEFLAVPEGDNTPVGVVWDASNGGWVTGPAEDDEEESAPITFNKKKYAVGENTGRVYLLGKNDDEEDTFVGFVGIGQFKDMKV